MIPLIVRADANERIGAGHVMRSAVLAEAWEQARVGPALLIGEITLPFVRERLRQARLPVDAVLPDTSSAVLVVDSYADDVRETVARSQARLAVLVDDVGGRVPLGTDVIWNPNPYGNAALYAGTSAQVLTGPDYVPLRRDLPQWRAATGGGTAVAVGGGSPPALVREVVCGTLAEGAWGVVIAAGGWSVPGWTLAPAAAPWQVMAGTVRAIVGAGTTALEAAAVGIPAVVVCVADNQEPALAWVRRSGGAAVDLRCGERCELVGALTAALHLAHPLPALRDGSHRVVASLEAAAHTVRVRR